MAAVLRVCSNFTLALYVILFTIVAKWHLKCSSLRLVVAVVENSDPQKCFSFL